MVLSASRNFGHNFKLSFPPLRAGWLEGTFGAQGTVQPIEAGYYRPILRRVNGVWKITTMRITHNIPYAFPGQ
jgi:hypothetical protein